MITTNGKQRPSVFDYVRSLVTTVTYDIVGLDVSQYQNEGNRPIDWTKAIQAGAKFAFIRGADVLYWDAWWERNLTQARAAGMPAKLYLVWTPALRNAVQLDFWRANIGDNVLGETPFALDVELNPTGLDPEIVTNRLYAMDDLIHGTYGFYPVRYSGKWWTDNNLLPDERANRAIQWAADYYPPLDVPVGWNRTKIWQYTSSGDAALYGCWHARNRVDLNYWIGDLAEFNEFWGITAPVPAPPPPVTPPVERPRLRCIRQVNVRKDPWPTAPDVGDVLPGALVYVDGLSVYTPASVWIQHKDGWSALVHNGVQFFEAAS